MPDDAAILAKIERAGGRKLPPGAHVVHGGRPDVHVIRATKPRPNGQAAELPKARFALMDDLTLNRDVFWAIDGVLPRCSMVMVYARGGGAKTYLMTSISIGIASGRWFDREAERGATLICAFERPDDTEDRLAALRERHDLRGLPVALMKLAGQKMTDEVVDEIIAASKQLSEATGLPVRAIPIDTVAAALCGEKEDDQGLGRLRAYGERIHAETGATVFWLHHEGKADHNGPRGHTTLADACMVWWRIEEREDGSRVVHVDKANRGPVHQALFAFRLVPFEAGRDRRGKAIELCDLELCNLDEALLSRVRERGGAGKSPQAGLGANQKLLLRELRKLHSRHPEGVEEPLLRSAFLLALAEARDRKGEPRLTPQQGAAKFCQTLAGLEDRGDKPPLIEKRAGLWMTLT